MKIRRCVSAGLLSVAACAAGAQAQTGAIPPLSAAQQARHDEAVTEAIVNGATALPGEIMKGSAVLQQQMGLGGAVRMLRDASRASDVITYSLAGARVMQGTARDGLEGFKRETIQFGLDQAGEMGGKALSAIPTGWAVASGASATTAFGAAGLAYATASVFGTYLRNDPRIARSMGLSGTVGDAVDNWYFAHTPDWAKEAIGGTPQVDLDDPKVWQKMADDAARNRRQATFDAVAQENAQQQRQLEAARLSSMAEAGPASTPAPSEPATSAVWQSLLEASRQANARRSSPVSPPAAAAGVCKLDPATGCHPGHDEKSHPGGCKKC